MSALAQIRTPSVRAPSWERMVLQGDTLWTPSGPVALTRAGRGMFTVAYRRADDPGRVLAVVDKGVWDKQILADAHAFMPDNPHLPAVTRLGALDDGRGVYEMPFYHAPFARKNATSEAVASFRAIEGCAMYLSKRKQQTGFDLLQRILACIEEDERVEPEVFVAIEVLAAFSQEYGKNYDMEFSPRNAATDGDGNLVLLDLLFDRDALRRKRAAKTRRERGT